jgi:hypothetical protein
MLLQIINNNINEFITNSTKNIFVKEDENNTNANNNNINQPEEKDKTNSLINEDEIDLNLIQNKRKKRSKKIIHSIKTNTCGHPERKHYAKNMCYNCYHRIGREKKAWKCSHGDKSHYALGYCHNCYHMIYKKEKPEIVAKAFRKSRLKKSIKNSLNAFFTKTLENS